MDTKIAHSLRELGDVSIATIPARELKPALRMSLERRELNGGDWALEVNVPGDGAEKSYSTRLRATPNVYRLRAN